MTPPATIWANASMVCTLWETLWVKKKLSNCSMPADGTVGVPVPSCVLTGTPRWTASCHSGSK